MPPHTEIPEGTKIGIEILDELINNIFGFHFLDPKAVPWKVYSVKPIFTELAQSKIVKSEIPYKMKNLGHYSAEHKTNPKVPLFEREVKEKKIWVP